MKLVTFILHLFFFTSLYAHPVIYKDGIVYWSQFANDMSTQRLSYSFSHKWSVELKSFWSESQDDYRDYTLGVNYLFKRWLNEDSQGNLYGGINTGYFHNDLDNEGGVSQAMLMADWESRKYYAAAHVMGVYHGSKDFYIYNARVGIAPYVAGMDVLQTWLVFNVAYFTENQQKLRFGPLLRFFYKNVLWEIGASQKGHFNLTLMSHF